MRNSRNVGVMYVRMDDVVRTCNVHLRAGRICWHTASIENWHCQSLSDGDDGIMAGWQIHGPHELTQCWRASESGQWVSWAKCLFCKAATFADASGNDDDNDNTSLFAIFIEFVNEQHICVCVYICMCGCVFV